MREFLIDNFELSRSDLTGLVRSLGDRVSDRLIPLEHRFSNAKN